LLHYVHRNTDDIVQDSVLTWSINCNMFVLPLTDFVTRDVTNIQTDRLKMFTERKTDHRCICKVSSSSTMRQDKVLEIQYLPRHDSYHRDSSFF
jgi:hypothetical protein